MSLNMLEVEDIVRRALVEDIGSGDITTTSTIPISSVSQAVIVAREAGVVAGLPVAALAFSLAAESYFGGVGIISPELLMEGNEEMKMPSEPHDGFRVTVKHRERAASPGKANVSRTPAKGVSHQLLFISGFADGSAVGEGEVIAEISGPTAVILTGERVALNFLQRMSGIATKTSRLVTMVKHTQARVVDTRKTTPGLRILEKYAVRCGGGANHRFGLYDAVLIKDNHVKASGGIAEAIRRAKSSVAHTIKIEVEAETIEQVSQALEAGADMILLDNMTPDELSRCVKICRGRALTEASGGITEESIDEVAETGVDLISIGALTHSVKALDLSLEIVG